MAWAVTDRTTAVPPPRDRPSPRMETEARTGRWTDGNYGDALSQPDGGRPHRGRAVARVRGAAGHRGPGPPPRRRACGLRGRPGAGRPARRLPGAQARRPRP